MATGMLFGHHYVLDVLAGTAYAVTGYCVVTAAEAWLLGSPRTCGFASSPVQLGEARC